MPDSVGLNVVDLGKQNEFPKTNSIIMIIIILILNNKTKFTCVMMIA